MKPVPVLRSKNHRSTRGGFSLIEILVVMAIIAILAVVAISSTTGTSKGAAAIQAANEVSDLFALARSEAVKTQGSAAVIVDAYPDPTNPLNYLHRLMIVDSANNTSYPNAYIQVSAWYNLPNGVFYYPQYSGPPTSGLTTAVSLYNAPFTANTATPPANNSGPANAAIFSGPAYVFTYSLNGQCNASQFVVVAAGENTATTPPTFIYPVAPAPTPMEGFYLHSLGRPTFFPDPQLIPTPAPTH